MGFPKTLRNFNLTKSDDILHELSEVNYSANTRHQTYRT